MRLGIFTPELFNIDPSKASRVDPKILINFVNTIKEDQIKDNIISFIINDSDNKYKRIGTDIELVEG